jgi:hypothetical protein
MEIQNFRWRFLFLSLTSCIPFDPSYIIDCLCVLHEENFIINTLPRFTKKLREKIELLSLLRGTTSLNKGNNKITELRTIIVKMYKDKEVKKNVKNMFLSMCDVKVFLTFTSLNMVLL